MPEWLLVPEDYRPTKDKEAFLRKSIESFLSLLARERNGGDQRRDQSRINPGLAVASCFLWVLLLSLSTSPGCQAVLGTLLLLLVAMRPAEQIISVLQTLLTVAAFSALLLAPAVFLGFSATAFSIAVKSLISVGFVRWLSLAMPWRELMTAFRIFRVPGIFLLILDLAVQYIVILGELVVEMLYALRLRSVGRNRAKTGALSGIVGMLFLKSQEMAQEVYWAMECRGFAAEYRPRINHHLSWIDGALFLLDLGLMGIFAVSWSGQR